MRHNKKRLNKIDTGIQKKDNLVRNMITSLVKNWEMVTTYKKWQFLKREIDKFFSRLVDMFEKYEDEKDVRRETIRKIKDVVYTEKEGKKIIDELLPKYKEENKTTGFVTYYKLGFRKWDGAEKVLLRLA